MLRVMRDTRAVEPGVVGPDHVDVADARIVGDFRDERLRAQLSHHEPRWRTGVAMSAGRDRCEDDGAQSAHDRRYWITTWLIGATFIPPG